MVGQRRRRQPEGRRQCWVGGLLMVMMLMLAACGASQAPASSPDTDPSARRDMTAGDEAIVLLQAEGETGEPVTARKVIARASMELMVADTEAAVADITALVDELGGYVSASDFSRYGSGETYMRGNMTLRVPAESLDQVLDQLAEIAVSVQARNLDREDVTEEYADIDSQLRNLEATEEELRAMLAEMRERPNATAEDIMAVYRTLTDVRGEIEQLRGRKNMLDNLISLSTIEVRLTPDVANLPVVDEGWRPTEAVRGAQRALVAVVQFLGNVVIWGVFFFLPLALIVLAPLALIGWLLRIWLRRAARRREATADSSAD